MIIDVPGEGPTDSNIAIIGEAPGKNEQIKGRPFVGASGVLLDYIGVSSGFGSHARQQWYITNVIKTRPPNNYIGKYIKFGTKKVTETPEFVECKEYLFKELNDINANVLVPMGRVSLYALTGRFDIKNARGSVLPCTIPGLEHCKVIPTYHPAYSFRKFEYRYLITMDFSKVLKESKFKGIKSLDLNMIIGPTFSQVIDYLNDCMNPEISNNLVSYDIETSSNVLISIGFSHSNDSGICIPLLSMKGESYSYFTEQEEIEILTKIKELCENTSVVKLLQNALFDTSFLLEYYGILTTNYEDTLTMAKLAAPDFPGSLEFLTSIYTDIPFYKGDLKMWKELPGNMEVLWKYNVLDCIATRQIGFPIYKDLKSRGLLDTYSRQNTITMPLCLAQTVGIPVNHAKLSALRVESAYIAEESKKTLLKSFGEDIDIASPAQLCDYFYRPKVVCPLCAQNYYFRAEKPRKTCPKCKKKFQEDYLKNKIFTVSQQARHYPLYAERKKDGVRFETLSVDESALSILKVEYPEIVEQLIKYRTVTKFNSTYLNSGLKNGCVRTSFNVAVVGSGRLSSSNRIASLDKGVPFQILPPEYRKLLESPPGCLAVQFDYSMAENRCVGFFAGDTVMIKAFQENTDLHKLTAWYVLKYGFNKDISIDEITKEQRQEFGKVPNHGLNYGMSLAGFTKYTGLPIGVAKIVFNIYHGIYANIQKVYHYRVRSLLESTRTLINPFSRSRKFLLRIDKDLYKLGYDWLPQSTVGDLMNKCGINKVFFNRELLDVYICNQIHDGIWYFIQHRDSTNHVMELLNKITNIMEEEIVVPWNSLAFTIPVDISIGNNFGYHDSAINTNGLREIKYSKRLDSLDTLESLVQESIQSERKRRQ